MAKNPALPPPGAGGTDIETDNRPSRIRLIYAPIRPLATTDRHFVAAGQILRKRMREICCICEMKKAGTL
jgi:hypothetical protein